MSIAAAAAEYIFSDSLLKDSADARFKGLRLELPADRLLKFVTVGLPLMLISLAFAQEISIGTQISCFPPANFSWRQAIYADAFCWASLLHHGVEADGTPYQQSLWIHKVSERVSPAVAPARAATHVCGAVVCCRVFFRPPLIPACHPPTALAVVPLHRTNRFVDPATCRCTGTRTDIRALAHMHTLTSAPAHSHTLACNSLTHPRRTHPHTNLHLHSLVRTHRTTSTRNTLPLAPSHTHTHTTTAPPRPFPRLARGPPCPPSPRVELGSKISCYPPVTFTRPQGTYVDACCWASLPWQVKNDDGAHVLYTPFLHKMFPYALLLIAVAMYVPALFWRFAMVPLLSSDLVFIMEELDKSYNRSVRLAQHIVQRCPRSDDANNLFYDEVDRARRENYFEFPLLEKYLGCKRESRELLWRYVARNLLVLLLMLLSCLYLGFYHAVGSLLDEFSCNIKTGLLANDSYVPGLIQCKLTSVRIFYVLSLINMSVYVLASSLVFYNVGRLWWPDHSFLDVYEMLPSFEVLSRRGDGPPQRGGAACRLPSDLSVILLFLGANVHELKSYKRLVVFRSVRSVPSAYNVDTLVDTMTILAGFEMSRRPGAAGDNASGPGSSEVDGARAGKDAKGALRQQQQKQASSPSDTIRTKLLRQRQQDQNTASTNV